MKSAHHEMLSTASITLPRSLWLMLALCCVSLLLAPLHLAAQMATEQIVPLPRLKARQPHNPPQLRNAVELPLYDDFSRMGNIPQTLFWEKGGGTSMHARRAIAPPTIGALTFDATQADGVLYPGAGRVPFPADTLRSLPIDLPNESDTTLYLSFQFQPGGYADAPNTGDSLLLDFYSPARQEWRTVWRASYNAERKTITQHYLLDPNSPTTTEYASENPQAQFHRMHIPVRGTIYWQPNFRFRIRNYASIPREITTPGRSANASQWHIDLLYLNRLRAYNDTTINDVACTSLPTTPFGPYTAIPQEAFLPLLRQRPPSRFDSIAFEYRNLSSERKNVGRRFSITNLNQPTPATLPFSGGAHNMAAFALERCSRSYEYDWEALAGKPIKIQFTAFLITEKTQKNAPFRWNDTVRSIVEYGDAYAYDSGEPNTGYGIVGVGAERAAVATRFTPLAPTAIKGIRVWFNHILAPTDRKNIRLTIWEDQNGKPGRILTQQLATPPQKANQLGQFTYYELETPLRFDAPIHVGWIQTNADMINVGFDRSAPNQPTIHYKTTGQWETSAAQGALLLRIVCGGTGEYPPDQPTTGCRPSIPTHIHPNPVATRITITCEAPHAKASIHSLTGQTLLAQIPCNQPVDMQNLPTGTYLLRIVAHDGSHIATHRIIKQ